MYEAWIESEFVGTGQTTALVFVQVVSTQVGHGTLGLVGVLFQSVWSLHCEDGEMGRRLRDTWAT